MLPEPALGPAAAPRRFLFVAPPFVGHVNPLLGVAARLRRDGHEVTWVVDPALVRSPETVRPVAFDLPSRPPAARGFAALKYLWEDVLVPLADAMADPVAQAVADVRPDLVVSDQQAIAGALVAERLGVPWATSATTSSELTAPLAGQPRIADWHAQLLAAARSRHGDPGSELDPRFSPTLLLLFSTAELTGPLPVHPTSLEFVGPALPARPPAPCDPSAPVLVTMGTANPQAAARFLDVCSEALAGRPAIIVDPSCTGTTHRGTITRVPYVDQLDVLGRSAAVICHGGHNTVCETLWHGLPLVVAPIRDDQPIVAEQVVRAGAGVRLRFDRAGAADVRAAIDTVSNDPAYTAAAATVGASFRRAGGVARAAELLVAAAVNPRTPRRHSQAALGARS